jgi:hypothetical protein
MFYVQAHLFNIGIIIIIIINYTTACTNVFYQEFPIKRFHYETKILDNCQSWGIANLKGTVRNIEIICEASKMCFISRDLCARILQYFMRVFVPSCFVFITSLRIVTHDVWLAESCNKMTLVWYINHRNPIRSLSDILALQLKVKSTLTGEVH